MILIFAYRFSTIGLFASLFSLVLISLKIPQFNSNNQMPINMSTQDLQKIFTLIGVRWIFILRHTNESTTLRHNFVIVIMTLFAWTVYEHRHKRPDFFLRSLCSSCYVVIVTLCQDVHTTNITAKRLSDILMSLCVLSSYH